MSAEQIPPASTPVTGSVTANAGTNLNTSLLATEITLGTRLTEADFDTKVGSLTETAPATDTASSGLNGRLQRIAQRLTSLITALGSPFQAGGSIGNTTFAATQATASSLNATVVGTGTFATQATLAAGTAIVGTVYDEPDDTWYKTHVPAVNTQATITQASAGGSLKNVCTGFTVTLCSGSAAPTAAVPVTVALIDGATGGTTYLWRTNVPIPTSAGVPIAFAFGKGKWIGSAATAMTLEFSAAGGGNTFESVTMKGYTK